MNHTPPIITGMYCVKVFRYTFCLLFEKIYKYVLFTLIFKFPFSVKVILLWPEERHQQRPLEQQKQPQWGLVNLHVAHLTILIDTKCHKPISNRIKFDLLMVGHIGMCTYILDKNPKFSFQFREVIGRRGSIFIVPFPT